MIVLKFYLIPKHAYANKTLTGLSRIMYFFFITKAIYCLFVVYII